MAISRGAAKVGTSLLLSCGSHLKCRRNGLQPMWWLGGASASARHDKGGWKGRVGAGEQLPARRVRQGGARNERGITPPVQGILAVAKRDASARGGFRSESNVLFGHRRMSSSWGNDGDDFTSKHFRVPAGAVDQLADRMGWKSRRSGVSLSRLRRLLVLLLLDVDKCAQKTPERHHSITIPSSSPSFRETTESHPEEYGRPLIGCCLAGLDAHRDVPRRFVPGQ